MKKFVLVVLGIAAVGVIVAFYMGAFQRVAITEEDRGPYTLVYRDMATGATVTLVRLRQHWIRCSSLGNQRP